MFLTTESSLVGKNYNALQVIYATACVASEGLGTENAYTKRWDTAAENALRKLYTNATNLHADGVIGVSLSTSALPGGMVCVTVMGTAIKFF